MRSFFPSVDLRIVVIILILMGMSLLVISSMTSEMDLFFTPLVKSQIKWFMLGWAVFFFTAMFDYRHLRKFSLFLYLLSLLLLIGLFFVPSIQNVHRWYRLFGSISFQPSEQAKLILIIFLSWYFEREGERSRTFISACKGALFTFIPFVLIAKQPDLGTALIILPIALVLFYLANIPKSLLRIASFMSVTLLSLIMLIFVGVLDHEKMRPVFTKVMKNYQYERLSPNSYHQRASQIALAIGGVGGLGWQKSEYAKKKWLPAAHTDSVFAAFTEEFGLLGALFLLTLFFSLIYFSFQVSFVARDLFGRYLAAGLAAYFASHVLVNVAMMAGLVPISGVPLLFITYGGSCTITSMAALGLLQSIYARRFMF